MRHPTLSCIFSVNQKGLKMNFKHLLVIGSITLSCLGISASQAATFTGPLFIDIDGDGTVSSDEIQTASTQYYASLVAIYDIDGDGKLSDSEKMTLRADRQAEKLAIYDADGNGELSFEERQAIRVARKAAIKAAFDSNNDGKLSGNEDVINSNVMDEPT